MSTAIVEIVASLIGWFSARGIDAIIGKYLAMIQIAFDKAASKSAREAYSKAYEGVAEALASKSDQWAKWRDGTGK